MSRLISAFHPAIDTPNNCHAISSHLTTGVANNVSVSVDKSRSVPNWLEHPAKPSHQDCSTPTWWIPMPAVVSAAMSIKLSQNMVSAWLVVGLSGCSNPRPAKMMMNTCGQRCQIHSVHGARPPICSKANAPKSIDAEMAKQAMKIICEFCNRFNIDVKGIFVPAGS